jgi:predicted dehydrogenase
MEDVSVGIIGAGNIATSIHLPILAAMNGVRIAWIADANQALAQNVARLNGLSAASLQNGPASLPQADAVLLAIPLPPRPAYLDYFAETETAILLEKPLANSAQDHEMIAARFPDWQVGVGYQRRYYATSVLMRHILESGTLGALRHIRIAEGGRTTRTGGGGEYQNLPVSKGGGIVKNLGCHSLDLVIALTGATGFRIDQHRVEWDGDSDQACSAQISLENGMGTSIGLDWSVSWIDTMANNVEFHFADAVVRFPVSASTAAELCAPDGRRIAMLDASGPDRAASPIQAFYHEWRDFLTAAQARTAQTISPGSTILSARLMDALLAR